MALEWRLRQMMAQRGIWSGAELGRLLEHKAGYTLSAPSISALLTESPRQMKAQTMDALCTALECTPSDLWHHTPSRMNQVPEQQEQPRAVNDASPRVFPPF